MCREYSGHSPFPLCVRGGLRRVRVGGRDFPMHARAASTVAGGKRLLLLVYHSRTGWARQMAKEMEAGAQEAVVAMEGEDTLDVVRKTAACTTSADILGADGYLFCAPENLASVSGEMKEFFDRTYYDMFDEVEGSTGYDEVPRLLGRPYALAIAAGSDGHGAARQIERICLGWRLDAVAETLVERNGLEQTKASILGEKQALPPDVVARCRDVGGIVAATLLL